MRGGFVGDLGGGGSMASDRARNSTPSKWEDTQARDCTLGKSKLKLPLESLNQVFYFPSFLIGILDYS